MEPDYQNFTKISTLKFYTILLNLSINNSITNSMRTSAAPREAAKGDEGGGDEKEASGEHATQWQNVEQRSNRRVNRDAWGSQGET